MSRLAQEEDRVKAKVQEVPVSFKAETMNNNNRNRNNNNYKKNITCYGCGKTGHKKTEGKEQHKWSKISKQLPSFQVKPCCICKQLGK